jgi:hypothetical protein
MTNPIRDNLARPILNEDGQHQHIGATVRELHRNRRYDISDGGDTKIKGSAPRE